MSKLSVTAVLLSYNCEEFIEAALESVLVQDYEEFTVLVSDDASTDGTFSALRHTIGNYDGPLDITLNRRQFNSGSKTAHLNDVLRLVTSEIVISFDGDDVARPQRISRIVEEFQLYDNVQAVYSSYSFIDRQGNNTGPAEVPHPEPHDNIQEWFARVDAYAAGSTLAFRRSVFEIFGPMDPKVNEDMILPFRASLLGEVKFVDKDLVRFRRHTESLTTDVHSLDSLRAFRERYFSGIAMARKSADVRLADIETALTLESERADELTELRVTVLLSRDNAVRTGGLLDKRLLIRLKTLFDLFRTGAYARERLQHLLLAISPDLYVRVQRFRIVRKVS